MLELKRSDVWHHYDAHVLPTANLTATESRHLAARDALITGALAAQAKGEFHLRVNKGIHKGSIFRITPGEWHISMRVGNYAKEAASNPNTLSNIIHAWKLDRSKGWVLAPRYLHWSAYQDRESPKPVKLADGWIFPEFFSTEIHNSLSLLIDYQGPEVYVLDESKRSPVFMDRLDQEVVVGDLVVVALNYGAGLDVCMVRGFADERRVVIESIEDKTFDRIPLEDDATRKIMRMPNNLRDTALMIKLGRAL